MTKLLIGIILALPIHAICDESIKNDIFFLGKVTRIAKSGPHLNYSHYCHLNTVYLSGSETKLESMALVWNHSTGQPLKCTEYTNYIKQTDRK